jgi:hypothetical protein
MMLRKPDRQIGIPRRQHQIVVIAGRGPVLQIRITGLLQRHRLAAAPELRTK